MIYYPDLHVAQTKENPVVFSQRAVEEEPKKNPLGTQKAQIRVSDARQCAIANTGRETRGIPCDGTPHKLTLDLNRRLNGRLVAKLAFWVSSEQPEDCNLRITNRDSKDTVTVLVPDHRLSDSKPLVVGGSMVYVDAYIVAVRMAPGRLGPLSNHELILFRGLTRRRLGI